MTNRLVTILTPVLAASGAVVAGLAQKYLGAHISPDGVTALEISVLTSITAIGYKALHGQQVFKQLEHEAKVYAPQVEQVVHAVDPTIDAQKTAEDIKTAAANEAQVILKNAESKASEVVQQAAAKLQSLAPAQAGTEVASAQPSAPTQV